MDTSLYRKRDLSSKKMELLKSLLKKEGIESTHEDTALTQPALQVVSRAQPLLLSFAQQRLWFLEQLDPGSVAYTIPLVLRLRGSLDLLAIQTSLRALIQRHEVLRTTFGSHEGHPIQQIIPDPPLDCSLLDLAHLSSEERRVRELAWLAAELEIPFDLERGPLLRVRLLRCGAQEHVLLLLFHHIIFDGWSMEVLLRELTPLYLAALSGEHASLPPLPVQYADYAAWQRSWLQGEVLQEQLAYWQQQLQGVPAFLDLPTDFPRPPLQTFRGHSLAFTLPPALHAGLERLSRQEGATLFMTLLAAWQVLLSRYTGQDDVVVGSPIANRSQAEIEGLIGFFVNTLALRTDLSGNPNFHEVLRRVREVALGAYSHQELPFERVVEAVQPPRDASRSPLFQVMFALEVVSSASLALPGLQMEPVEVEDQVAKFDLSLFMQAGPDGLQGVLEYNCDLFTAETIQRLIKHWTVLVQDIVAHPMCPIGHLALLSAREQHMAKNWNTTEHDYKMSQCIHELFEAQVERTPDAVALCWEEEQLSYRHLNERANQLARQLQAWGVHAETPVGICLRRSPFLLISLLAVLKAGGAYLPLDPVYPAERLAFMVQDAQAPLVLTQRSLYERVPEMHTRTRCIEEEEAGWSALPTENLGNEGSAEQLAYIIYTSGSTGQPKGVMIAHRNTVAMLQWARECFSAQEMAGMLASTSVCFDVSVFELFAPLCSGGTVIMAEDILKLPSLANTAQVTMICAVPSVIAELVRSGELPATVQSVNFAGEALSQKLAQQTYESGLVEQVRNIYGPTEDTTYSTYALLERDATTAPPLGQPLPGGEVYLLDRALQPVPIGIVGEIFLAGVGLARGYWQRPDLTAERFIPHPFSEQAGARLYRTGDLGRRLANGTLEYLGRVDHQVKIRGIRIELGEITARLQSHPMIQECMVVAQKVRRDEKEVIAYLVGETLPLSEELRAFLQEQLPGYMVPAYFVHLDAFPLLTNGKIDRSALPAPNSQRTEDMRNYIGPRDSIEAQLVSIWEEVLQRSQIGITDNFFEVGGHSLLAVTLINQVKKVFQRALPLAALFSNATIQSFAELLREPEQQLDDVSSALVPIQPQGTKIPLFFIHPIGGEVLCYRDLASQLGIDHPFYGLRFPFREEAVQTPLRMENLAAHYIDALRAVQPQGPYILGGWSLGGTIAHAMAHQLRVQGEEISALVFIDSYAPALFGEESDEILLLLEMVADLAYSAGNALPDVVTQPDFRENLYHRLKQLSPEERLRSIWEQGQSMRIIPAAFTLPQMRQLFFVFRTNTTVVRNYTPVQTDQRIMLFKPDEGRDVMDNGDDGANGWNALNKRSLEIYLLPGTHYTLLKRPCVDLIAEQLRVVW